MYQSTPMFTKKYDHTLIEVHGGGKRQIATTTKIDK